MTIRAISYGGGVQSTALLVLAAAGRIDFPVFLFANVGDDSEDPRTLDYVRDVAAPYAADHGIELVELVRRHSTTGEVMTIRNRIEQPESRSVGIPVYMSNGAPGNRSCTAEFKIKVIAREVRRRGATRDDPAIVGVGISLDESHRANTRRAEWGETIVYPLIGVGEDTGLRLRRTDCVREIEAAGLPVPPKSSCYFCPFHRLQTWVDLRQDRPDLFASAVQLEDTINATRDRIGKDHVRLTQTGLPLAEAVDTGQPSLFGDTDEGEGGECDSGFCFT
jgi:hypothetical protein